MGLRVSVGFCLRGGVVVVLGVVVIGANILCHGCWGV